MVEIVVEIRVKLISVNNNNNKLCTAPTVHPPSESSGRTAEFGGHSAVSEQW